MKISLVFVLAILFAFSGCAVLDFPDQDPEDDYEGGYSEYTDNENYPDNDPDYSVSLFGQANFRGRRLDYFLEDGQRHELVRFVGWNLNDRVVSIGIGRGVGVALFRDRDFGGPVAVYLSSTDRLDSDLMNFVSSIIVFDLESSGPLGAWIGNGSPDIFTVPHRGQVKFLPMPEDGGDSTARIRHLEEFNDRVEWVIIGPAPEEAIRRANGAGFSRKRGTNPYGNRKSLKEGVFGARLIVTVHEHENYHGRYAKLSGLHGFRVFMMEEYELLNQASSVVITETW